MSGHRFVEFAIQRDNAFDRAILARRHDTDRIAWLHNTGGNQSGEAAEIEVWSIDPLHRHAERFFLRGIGRDLDILEMGDQGRAVIPGHIHRRRVGDIVALEARNRDRREILYANFCSKFAIFLDDIVKYVLVIIHQVHLVHRQHQILDPEQMGEIGMTPGLDQNPFPRIDQYDCGIGGRSACHHIAGILFVPRCIGDDELALFRRKKPIGDIDGDTLFAFCSETIHKQGEIYLLALCARLLAVRLQRSQLVFKNHLAVIEQPANQRALAIIHAAASDKAEQFLVLMLGEIGVNILPDQRVGLVDRVFFGVIGHQK